MVKDPGPRAGDQKARIELRAVDHGQWMESKLWIKLNYRYIKVYEILWAAGMAQLVESSPLTNLPYVSLFLVFTVREGFSPGTPVSLSPEKPTFLNSNSTTFSWQNSCFRPLRRKIN